MLTKYFLEFVIFIVSQLLTLISGLFPGLNNFETFSSALNSLLGVSTQITNFAYFILGDFYFVAMLLVGPTLVFRYLTVPLISFVRKIVVWGGN